MANVKKLNKLMVDKGTKLSFWLFRFTFEPKVRGLKTMQFKGWGREPSEAIRLRPVRPKDWTCSGHLVR